MNGGGRGKSYKRKVRGFQRKRSKRLTDGPSQLKEQSEKVFALGGRLVKRYASDVGRKRAEAYRGAVTGEKKERINTNKERANSERFSVRLTKNRIYLRRYDDSRKANRFEAWGKGLKLGNTRNLQHMGVSNGSRGNPQDCVLRKEKDIPQSELIIGGKGDTRVRKKIGISMKEEFPGRL